MKSHIGTILLTEGFKEAALKFQQEAGLQEPALCSSLDERIMIREAVQSGRIPEAIAMVNALHPELLDNDRYLYFHLQVCSISPHCYTGFYNKQKKNATKKFKILCFISLVPDTSVQFYVVPLILVYCKIHSHHS